MNIDSLISNIGSYTNEAIVIADADPTDGAILRIRWLNKAFTDLTGYGARAAIGRTAGMLTGESTEAAAYARVISDLQAWKSFDAELRLYRQGGDSFWAHLSFRPIRDETGTFRFWMLLMHDISGRKAAEDVLTDLSLIARTSTDMVFVLDRQRRIDWVNDSFVETTGYALDEVRGMRVGQVLMADNADRAVVDTLVAALDRHLPQKVDILSRHKDGSLFIGEYDYQPTFDDHGHFTKYVLLARDITHRVTLEQRYRAAFDETDAAICMKSGGRYLLVNSHFAGLFGRPTEDFMNAPADLLQDTPLERAIRKAEDHVLATGESRAWEITVPGEVGGSPRQLMAKTFRGFEDVLNSYTVCSVVTDITRIRQTELALSVEQEKATLAQKRLWSAIEGIPDGFVLYDEADRVLHANAAFRTMHGPIADRIVTGTTFEAILRMGLEAGLWDIHDQQQEAWLAERLAERATGQLALGSYFALANGGWMLAREIRLANGERAGIRIDATDIKWTEAALIAAQREAEKAESRLLAAISALEDSFTIYDSEDRLVISNVRHLGKPPETLRGMTFRQIVCAALERGLIVLPEGVAQDVWLEDRLRRHAEPGEPMQQLLSDGKTYRVVERKTNHGDTVTMRVDLTHEQEQQARLESYARDLEASKRLLEGRNAELERARKSLEHASLHDSLTGLPNRRYLERELRERGMSAPSRKLAVLHIDLDRFKQINDAFGHAAGDHVLSRAANILSHGVGAGNFCARVGGDEFVVLCTVERASAEALNLADRLIHAFRQPVRYRNTECRYGASIGIAFNDRDSTSAGPEQLLINADIALYRAKGSGRNRWAVFSETLQAEVLASKRLSDDILRGLDQGEFTALYQPQVHADDFSFAGVEALLRWNHPERGLLHPTSFMEAAEELNVVAQLDEIVLTQAAADDVFWRANGQNIPKIAVNVSAPRLRSPDFIQDIKGLGLDPARLSLELLETIFLDDEDELLTWTIDQIREMGVSVELDDFGTGHSSIIGLLKLKPSRLKIDKSFIDQILGACEAEALLRSIIDIGRNLNVEIVAEGIETLQQADMLRDMGCDVLQGFVFAEAMSANDVLGFAGKALAPRERHQGQQGPGGGYSAAST